jgi:hypothetical protein
MVDASSDLEAQTEDAERWIVVALAVHWWEHLLKSEDERPQKFS